MRRVIALACWLAAATASGLAHAQAFDIDARAPRFAPARADDPPLDGRLPDAKEVAMPWVHGGRAGVAARINDAIYLQLLDMLAPRAPGDTFTAPANGQLQYFCDIGFSVGRNDGRVLSIQMALGSLGSAHCSWYKSTLVFDARTGRELWWADILTAPGRDALIQHRNRTAIKANCEALAYLPPDPDDTDPPEGGTCAEVPPLRHAGPPPTREADPNHPDDEQRQFFRGCIWDLERPDPHAQLEFEVPAEPGLSLPLHPCAGDNRHEIPIDVTPEAVPIPVAELEPLLSAYGRRLLLGKGNAPAPADLFGHTLRGHVGSAPITLYLGRSWGEKNEMQATYAYDRIGTAITMFGNAAGDAIELSEGDGKGFALRRVGTSLVGTWHGNGKTLPVRLE